MDIENINATPIRNTKMYSKINKLFLRHLKEKGIITDEEFGTLIVEDYEQLLN